MNQFFTSASGLDARGVGPRIIFRTLPVVLAAVISEIWFAPIIEIPAFSNSTIKFAGWLWLLMGFVLFISSVVQFSRNFPKGNLLQTGMYAFSRNPIYSCWILFILPALWLVLNNWLFLLSAVVMCITTLILVKEEEVQLLQVFGKQYAKYRTQVGCIIWFTGKTKNEA